MLCFIQRQNFFESGIYWYNRFGFLRLTTRLRYNVKYTRILAYFRDDGALGSFTTIEV